MIDATEGYDPTKPLHIESPQGYLSCNALFFEPEENITSPTLFYPREPIATTADLQLIFRCNMSEDKLLKMDIVPSMMGPPGLIVNKKVLEILERTCSTDFQVFPVTIKSKDSKIKSKQFINKNYFLIHIIGREDAIDVENSEFSLVDKSKPKQRGNLFSPKKLRFKSNCMGDAHIACDIEVETLEFISQKLFHILHESDVKGAEFFPDYLSLYDRNNHPELFKLKS